MDKGSEWPRNANAEKYVDRIRAGHVTDGWIGIFVVNSGHFGSERVGYRRAKSYKCDGRYRIREANRTAEVRGEIADKCG